MKARFLSVVTLWFAFNAVQLTGDEPPRPLLSPLPTDTERTNQIAVARVLSFKLKPTAIAPAAATGAAEVKSGVLSLHLTHLGPGRYQLKAVRRSDNAFQHLGTIAIADPTLAPDRDTNDNKKEAAAGPQSDSVETDVQVKLPSEVSPRDIGRILLISPAGNPVLTSDGK